MKTIKKISLLIMGVLLMGSSFAQEKKKELTDEERVEKHVEKMTKNFELTHDQVVSATEIMKIHFNETADLRKQMEDLRGKMKVLRAEMKVKKEAHKTEIKEILNDDQKAKFEELEKKKAEKRAQKKAEKESMKKKHNETEE